MTLAEAQQAMAHLLERLASLDGQARELAHSLHSVRSGGEPRRGGDVTTPRPLPFPARPAPGARTFEWRYFERVGSELEAGPVERLSRLPKPLDAHEAGGEPEHPAADTNIPSPWLRLWRDAT